MLKKITLESVNIGYLPPKSGEEFMQKLTLKADGQVWFTSRTYDGESLHQGPVGRKLRKSIAPAEAQALLKRIEAYFEKTDPAFITDVGKYELTLCYDDGTSEILSGPLLTHERALLDLCAALRRSLDVPGLLLFDGGR